jgi:hypothetical protein
MKKIVKVFVLTLALLSVSAQAMAENIVVIDQNGNVIRQMFTSPATYSTAPVVAAPIPAVTVVRESPVVQQSYYYDSGATNAALAAGVTTAIVGGLLYSGYRHHHHHHHHGGWYPAPHHGGHHHRHH